MGKCRADPAGTGNKEWRSHGVFHPHAVFPRSSGYVPGMGLRFRYVRMTDPCT
ncbi:hypothetical protein ASZ90_015377 [hydrocarbon metagenome]|uniref:Uncharacterized protein n=1 Tax=hydrocarbon metagenome TaxID=938273 RepID=A0A0W8F2D4_9ZZZZ